LTVPSLCRSVIYRGRHGFHALRAAVVIATQDTLDPRGVEAGAVPALDSQMHVHLHVFTPSDQQGWTEYNVPYGDGPGQWSWPPRNG
jgi:hypothetical protein